MILSQSHPLALLLDAIFIGAVVVLIVINLKHLILPNAITYPGCAVAIVARAFIPNLASFGFLTRAPFSKLPTFLVSIDGAIIGLIVGGGTLLLVRWTWEKLRGIEVLGFGDVKMMCMVGAYLGIAKTVMVLSLAFALMLPLSMVVALTLLKQKNSLLPSGFIWGVPAIIVTLWGEGILHWLSIQL
jgi:leader peptidase (prepilin peptidase) / N-methyltransferase